MGPKLVKWLGKWRDRIFNKPKFYNRLRWFIDEGYSLERAQEALRKEKVEPLRKRLNREQVHGKRRERALSSKRRKINLAARALVKDKRV